MPGSKPAATDDPRINEAENRIQNTDPYDIKPIEMAQDIADTIHDGVDVHTLKNYISDRMWYRRGA